MMNQLFTLSDMEFKIILINMWKAQVEKMSNIHQQLGNFRMEVGTTGKRQMKY